MELNIWEGDNSLVTSQYEKDNYKIEIIDENNKNCAIVCSGNGLYFPNTVEEFTKTIIEKDRYEWTNVFSNPKVREKFGKVIYIRDVYKQWYVTGLNPSLNTVDSIVEVLKKETTGFRVVTLGNSAGGYMATLLGTLLNASCIYNFSGQYSLEDETEENLFLKKNIENTDINKYYNIAPMVAEHKLPIMYFYPGMAERDVKQCRLVEQYENVFAFRFNTKVHGCTMLGMNYSYILCMYIDELQKLCDYYRNKNIGRIAFLFKTAGFINATKELIAKFVKRRNR